MVHHFKERGKIIIVYTCTNYSEFVRVQYPYPFIINNKFIIVLSNSKRVTGSNNNDVKDTSAMNDTEMTSDNNGSTLSIPDTANTTPSYEGYERLQVSRYSNIHILVLIKKEIHILVIFCILYINVLSLNKYTFAE